MRRVALGSGLELTKLADTVRQLADADPPAPVLICQDDTKPDAWIHLSLTSQEPDGSPASEASWTLMLGYPAREDLESVMTAHHISLPAGSKVSSMEPGLHVTIAMPRAASPEAIARAIHQLMAGIQQVEAFAPIELTLEYP